MKQSPPKQLSLIRLLFLFTLGGAVLGYLATFHNSIPTNRLLPAPESVASIAGIVDALNFNNDPILADDYSYYEYTRYDSKSDYFWAEVRRPRFITSGIECKKIVVKRLELFAGDLIDCQSVQLQDVERICPPYIIHYAINSEHEIWEFYNTIFCPVVLLLFTVPFAIVGFVFGLIFVFIRAFIRWKRKKRNVSQLLIKPINLIRAYALLRGISANLREKDRLFIQFAQISG